MWHEVDDLDLESVALSEDRAGILAAEIVRLSRGAGVVSSGGRLSTSSRSERPIACRRA